MIRTFQLRLQEINGFVNCRRQTVDVLNSINFEIIVILGDRN